MFGQIAAVYERRINANLELLADIGVLMEPIESRHTRAIEALVVSLDRLGREAREAFAGDHVAHHWMRVVRAALLKAYSDRETQAARDSARDMILLFEISVASIGSTHYTFTLGDHCTRRFLVPVSGVIVDLTRRDARARTTCRYLPATGELEIDGHVQSLGRFPEVRGIRIVDSNLDLFADPTGGHYPVELDDAIDLASWKASCECALDLIQQDAVASALVERFATYLVPLKQGSQVNNLSFSVRGLPGVIFKNNELTPYLVGETLVHEADHQFFYAIEQIGAMWVSEATTQKPVYYSPWRDDPRPLDGILRGLSSFARVTQYYAALLTTDALDTSSRSAAAALLARHLGECEIALSTVLDSGELSAFGAAFVVDIQAALREVRARAETIPEFSGSWARASAEIALHRLTWEGAS